jgi:predicted porin
MKRTFANITFAVAAAGFATTNAAAEGTNVTVSGDIKAAATYGNGGQSPVDGEAADHVRLNDDSSYFSLSAHQDLPNGMYAGVQLDSFFGIDTGNDANGGGAFFSRRAVGKVGGAFGEVYFGRSLTPASLMVLFTDPWYWDGSVAQAGWMVQLANYTSTQYLRTNNTIGWVSPKTAGLTLSLAASAGEQAASKDLGGSLTYENGPLWAGVAYDQSHGFFNDPTLNHTLIAVGAYDFGVIRPMASFTSSKVAGVTYSSFTLAATAPAGEKGLFKAQYSHLNDVDTATVGRQAYEKVALGYQYNVLKNFNFFGQVSTAKEKSLSATNTLEGGVEYGF